MSLANLHLERLQKKFPKAELIQLGDGSTLIKIADFPLPEEKWDRQRTTAYFIAPVGYPMAPPDCFWTDPDLRLRTGAIPKGTGVQSPPFGQGPKLWFSWHTNSWSANRDDLLTYARIIQDRLDRGE